MSDDRQAIAMVFSYDVLRLAGAAALGAALGYGYYAVVGCRTGACPITSNPWVSSVYGAVLGLLMVRG